MREEEEEEEEAVKTFSPRKKNKTGSSPQVSKS
jgi:hypothetical protein